MPQDRDLFHIDTLVRVRHVQSGIGPSFDFETDFEEIEAFFKSYFEDYDEWDDVICLVTKENEPVGWFCLFEDLSTAIGSGETGTIGPGADPIYLTQVISQDVPLFEAADVLLKRHRPWLWVLENNRITGTFSYHDVFKLPGVLCLFALVIELENAALNLCRCFHKECWTVLSDGRREMATALWHRRHDRDATRRDTRLDRLGARAYYEGQIECTTFIDKATMISKCKLLPDIGPKEVDSVFRRAEEVRNACAHPAETDRLESILPPDKYIDFISACRQLIDAISTATPDDQDAGAA